MKDYKCMVADCIEKSKAKGLCSKHYKRWRKYGDPLKTYERSILICKVENCSNISFCRELCRLHYGRWRKHGDPTILLRSPNKSYIVLVCRIEGCERPIHAKSLCDVHYRRFKNNGDPLIVKRRKYEYKFDRYFTNYFYKIRNQAKARKIDFNLNQEYLWNLWLNQKSICNLSGLPITFDIEQTASLDRIISSKGYVEGNVQWVHKDVNRMKLNHNQDYFIHLCEAIAYYQNNS